MADTKQLTAQQEQEIYQERLRTYKQLENDIKTFQDEMNSQFKKQQVEVNKYETENKKLG